MSDSLEQWAAETRWNSKPLLVRAIIHLFYFGYNEYEAIKKDSQKATVQWLRVFGAILLANSIVVIIVVGYMAAWSWSWPVLYWRLLTVAGVTLLLIGVVYILAEVLEDLWGTNRR